MANEPTIIKKKAGRPVGSGDGTRVTFSKNMVADKEKVKAYASAMSLDVMKRLVKIALDEGTAAQSAVVAAGKVLEYGVGKVATETKITGGSPQDDALSILASVGGMLLKSAPKPCIDITPQPVPEEPKRGRGRPPKVK